MSLRFLDFPATPQRLYRLLRGGRLSAEHLPRALELAAWEPDRRAWLGFCERVLLLVGSVLLLAGILFFFAYNWADLHRLAKLALLQGGVVLCVALAWWRGLAGLSGQAALLGASVLVGGLLAVFGQMYQTGADPYTLFLGWAGLIAGWVALGRFAGLWLLWLALLEVALVLYWQQVVGDSRHEEAVLVALALLNGLALVVWESAAARGVAWLRERWGPRLIACALLSTLSLAVIVVILDGPKDSPLLELAPLLYLAMLFGGGAYYQFRARDLFMLAGGLFSLMGVANTWLVKALDVDWFDYPLLLLLLAAFWAGQSAAAAAWLWRKHRAWEEE